tara:strand:- start:668 stop:2854 length:2187 start_codon:yes stop_codon:yes gene_type:complete
MKKLFYTTFIILIFILVLITLILSTLGIETDKFNKFITNKAVENNKSILLKLDKVNFKFDIKDFNLFLETKKPEFTYKNLKIPIQNVRVYLDFYSLIKSKSKVDKINITTEEININQLKKIIIKTKPSNLNSLISNKVKNGKLIINLELYFNDNLEVENFIAKGQVKEMSVVINKDLTAKKASFNFFGDSSDILVKNIKSELPGILIKDGNLQITRNNEINLKSEFSSEIAINKKNIINYLPFFKKIKLINIETNLNTKLDNFLNITFDKTFKVTDYEYTNKGVINNSVFKFEKPFQILFLEKDIEKLFLKDTNFKVRYAKDKKNYIHSLGIYSVDDKNYQNYDFKNNFLNETLDIDLNFEFIQKLKIDFINYKKDNNKIAKIYLDIYKKKDRIELRKFNYQESKNQINIEKLKIDKNSLISLQKVKVKTYDNNNLKNDFTLFFGKKINITGNKYDAKNLNKFLNLKSNNNILKKVNKEINIDLKNIDTPLSKKLKNFRLIGLLEKGKFVKISSKGDFGDNKFLDISMKNDKKSKKKYLEVYSDLPQPLLSEYSFFKGLSEGVLNFSSIIEGDKSTSKLIIENFKVVNAPGVVKLLSLADFGGLADLAEGEGLSFEKMEIKMSNDKKLLKLNELYAVGPSISVLMEGYKDNIGMTSLKGTLVPAKNLNILLSKIPVIGKIIIPEEVGEGLFGVSFKIKGMPGKMKTSINPIKTLTPRFITKALEKKSK